MEKKGSQRKSEHRGSKKLDKNTRAKFAAHLERKKPPDGAGNEQQKAREERGGERRGGKDAQRRPIREGLLPCWLWQSFASFSPPRI